MGVGNEGSSSSLSDNLSSVAFSTFTAFYKLGIKVKILIENFICNNNVNISIQNLTTRNSTNLRKGLVRPLFVNIWAIKRRKTLQFVKSLSQYLTLSQRQH